MVLPAFTDEVPEKAKSAPTLHLVKNETVPSEENLAPAPSAGVVRRALAFFFDCFLVSLFNGYFLQLFLNAYASRRLGMDIGGFLQANHAKALVLKDLGTLYLFVGYTAVFHWYYGATLGKMMFRLRVVKDSGRSLRFLESLVRSCAYLVSYFPMGLGFAVALIRKDKRSLHDLLSRSFVRTV